MFERIDFDDLRDSDDTSCIHTFVQDQPCKLERIYLRFRDKKKDITNVVVKLLDILSNNSHIKENLEGISVGDYEFKDDHLFPTLLEFKEKVYKRLELKYDEIESTNSNDSNYASDSVDMNKYKNLWTKWESDSDKYSSRLSQSTRPSRPLHLSLSSRPPQPSRPFLPSSLKPIYNTTYKTNIRSTRL